MHQPFLIVDALFQGDHGFGPVNAFNIIDHKDNFFSMRGILCPDLAEDIELAGSDMSNGNIWDFIDPFQNKFGL